MATYGNKNMGNGDIITWTKYTVNRVEIKLNGRIICVCSEEHARRMLGCN